MGRRQQLIKVFASDLREHCKMQPEMDLLEKVAIGCGPALFDPAAVYVRDDVEDLKSVRENFLVRKLTLPDGPELLATIKAALRTYGSDEVPKYRAVLFYMLVKRFGREAYYR